MSKKKNMSIQELLSLRIENNNKNSIYSGNARFKIFI